MFFLKAVILYRSYGGIKMPIVNQNLIIDS